MTIFNPENKNNLTFGECLDPAMNITDKADAEQYLKNYVEFIEKTVSDKNGLMSIEIAKRNLGYYAGYYSNETRERVEELFDCEHPFFGRIKENGAPTAKQALDIGMKLAERSKLVDKNFK